MFTVQHVITSARDRHRAFTPQQTPDPVLVRAISEYHQLLAGKALEINPALVAAVLDVALPLADFDAGVALPQHFFAQGHTVHSEDDEYPLTLISPSVRTGPFPGWPAAYVEGSTLYLAGRAEHWEWYDRLTVRYSGIPASFTKLSDTFALPASCFPALVARAALLMATRGTTDQTVPAIPHRGVFAGELVDAEAAFLGAIAARKGAITMQIRDVY